MEWSFCCWWWWCWVFRFKSKKRRIAMWFFLKVKPNKTKKKSRGKKKRHTVRQLHGVFAAHLQFLYVRAGGVWFVPSFFSPSNVCSRQEEAKQTRKKETKKDMNENQIFHGEERRGGGGE